VRTILIIDDDSRLRNSFERILTEEGYTVRTAATGEDGLELIRESVPALVIMDVRMPGMSGLEAFQKIREIDSKLPVIIMTAYSTTETAIEATKMGAFDYILKPFKIPEVLELIEQALEADRLMRTDVRMDEPEEIEGADVMIGRSEAMQQVFKAIGRVAATSATVLIRGASGTGKELVARAIYQHSLRKDQPFVVINCVAIPETLLESELFGYEKGAFTGADRQKIGKIEQANGGTIFLDEIGDMPMGVQAKILRLLQEKSIERLGSREIIPVDVRIIAATNRNLEDALRQDIFREDLYYRLRVVTIDLPPLCERDEDVNLLCDYFLARFSRELGNQPPELTAEAREFILHHPWPGNVRELSNTLQKAVIFSRGMRIRPEDLMPGPPGGDKDKPLSSDAVDTLRSLVRSILMTAHRDDLFVYLRDLMTETTISEALNITGGNRSRAAKLLGITRPTLHARLEKHNQSGTDE